MKYLVLLGVLAVVYMLWKHRRVQERAARDGQGQRPASAGARQARPQEMVRCAACDLHLPHTDAVADAQGRLYCSPAHRDKANA